MRPVRDCPWALEDKHPRRRVVRETYWVKRRIQMPRLGKRPEVSSFERAIVGVCICVQVEEPGSRIEDEHAEAATWYGKDGESYLGTS